MSILMISGAWSEGIGFPFRASRSNEETRGGHALSQIRPVSGLTLFLRGPSLAFREAVRGEPMKYTQRIVPGGSASLISSVVSEPVATAEPLRGARERCG